MGDSMRLHLGCGDVRPVGWCHVDPFPSSPEHVIVADPARGPLPWPDGTFDGAVAMHVLMMVPWPDLVPWLVEVRRVLKPGGVLRLSVPDLLAAFDAYDEHQPDWFPIDPAIEDSIDGRLCVYLTQAGATRSVFTGPWLAELLARAGYRDVVEHDEPGVTCSPHQWMLDLDTRWDESIYVEALA